MNSSAWKLSLKFFIAKKGRSFFSILGISLGILLVTAVQIVFSTLDYSYAALQRQQYGDYDVLAYNQSVGSGLTTQMLAKLKNVQGIESLQPILYPYQGQSPRYSTDSLFYVGLTDTYLSKQLKNYEIIRGHFPHSHEVALSPEIMLQHHLHIGSAIELNLPHKGVMKFIITGELPPSSQVHFATAVFDYSWLQKITGMTQSTGVIMKLNPRLNSSEKNAVLQTIREDLYKMVPHITIDTRDQLSQQINYTDVFLPIVRALSITSIIASISIVISTLQISLQERRKDFSTLRLLGIKGSQLSLLILIESLIYGLFSTVVGISLGIGVSFLIKTVSTQLFHVSMTIVIIQWSTLVWIALCSITMIILAGLIPGLWARRLSPIEAYRTADPSGDSTNGIVTFFLAPSLVAISVILVLLTHILKLNVFIYLFSGLCFVVGMYMWIPQCLQSSSRLFSWALKPLFGSNVVLASRNINRYKRRSTLCVGALMLAVTVGMAGMIVLNVIVVGQTRMVNFNYPEDVILRAVDFHGFSSGLKNQVRSIKGISTETFTNLAGAFVLNAPNPDGTTPMPTSPKGVQHTGLGSLVTLVGSHLEEDKRIDPFQIIAGRIDSRALGNDGVVLTKSEADALGFKVGDTMRLKKGFTNQTLTLKVVGIIKGTSSTFSSPWAIVNPTVMEHNFSIHSLSSIQIKITSGDARRVIQSLQAFLKNPQYQDVQLINKMKEKQIAQQPSMLFSIVLTTTILTIVGIATLGLMNHTASSIRQRSREFATMRAVGTTRPQMMRLILAEGMMTSVLGGILGVVTGGGFAYLALLSLNQARGVSFPLSWIYGTIFISPILGLFASWSTSIWASRQDILSSLSNY